MKTANSNSADTNALVLTRKSLMPRLVVIGLVAASAGLLFFSLWRVTAAQREANRLSAEVQKCTDEIDRIQMQWNPAATSSVSRAYAEGKGTLMHGEEAITRWMQGVRESAKPLALEVQERFGQATPHPAYKTNFLLMPVTLEIRPVAGEQHEKQPYERLLALCQKISLSPERVDWLDLSVSGASNSVNRATAMVQLWVSDNLPD